MPPRLPCAPPLAAVQSLAVVQSEGGIAASVISVGRRRGASQSIRRSGAGRLSPWRRGRILAMKWHRGNSFRNPPTRRRV